MLMTTLLVFLSDYADVLGDPGHTIYELLYADLRTARSSETGATHKLPTQRFRLFRDEMNEAASLTRHMGSFRKIHIVHFTGT